MARLCVSLFTGGLAAAASFVSVVCSRAATQADVAQFTRLRIDVVTQAGAPVVNAFVAVRVFNPHGVVLESGEGATDGSGSYVYARATALEGVYPTTVRVDPPEGSGLLPVEVNDSTEYVRGTPTTKIVTVTLSTQPQPLTNPPCPADNTHSMVTSSRSLVVSRTAAWWWWCTSRMGVAVTGR